MLCVYMFMKEDICHIWVHMYRCFVCAGESWANPVCVELHWGWSSPADSSRWLPQPTHGESLCGLNLFFYMKIMVVSLAWCFSSALWKDYVQALTGLCYDGVEGLIYLVLFSFVTALMFSSIVCSVPHTWPRKRYHTCTSTFFPHAHFPLAQCGSAQLQNTQSALTAWVWVYKLRGQTLPWL